MTTLPNPTVWGQPQLEADAGESLRRFRELRLGEPLKAYTDTIKEYRKAIAPIIATLKYPLREWGRLAGALADPRGRELVRSLAGPPISEDDLDMLAEVRLARSAPLLGTEALARVAEVVSASFDHERFPWTLSKRSPGPAELEGAILATAAIIAVRKSETRRRHEVRKRQESAVAAEMILAGLTQIPTRREVRNIREGPGPGQFMAEAKLAYRQADFIVGLFDQRCCPIECKVSSSTINSIKRLNSDAQVKAEHWRTSLGSTQIVPIAVLSGAFALQSL